MDWHEDLWSRRLYVAEFKTGLIKIGITSFKNHQREIGLKCVGGPLVRIHYGEFHACGFLAERLLIQRLRRMACTFKGREWFTNVRFGAVRTLIAQVTRDAIAQAGTQQPLPT